MGRVADDAATIELWVVNTANLHEIAMELCRKGTPPEALNWRELAKEAARQVEIAENRTRDRMSDKSIEIAGPMLQEVFIEKVREEDRFKFNGENNGKS